MRTTLASCGMAKKLDVIKRFMPTKGLLGLEKKQAILTEDKRRLAIGIQTTSAILRVHASSIRRFPFIWAVMMGYGTAFSLTTPIEANLTLARQTTVSPIFLPKLDLWTTTLYMVTVLPLFYRSTKT